MADFKGMRIAKVAGGVKPRVDRRLRRRQEPAQIKRAPGPSSSGPSSREAMARMLRDFGGSVDKLRAAIEKAAEQKPQAIRSAAYHEAGPTQTGRDVIHREIERIDRVAGQLFPRDRELRKQITSDFRERAAKTIKAGEPQMMARLLQLTADVPPPQRPRRKMTQAMLTNELRRSPSKVGAKLAEMIRSGEAAKLVSFNSGGVHKVIAALEKHKGPSPQKSARAELRELIEKHRLVPLSVQIGHMREMADRGAYRPYTPPPSRDLRLQQVLAVEREIGRGPSVSVPTTGTAQPEVQPVEMAEGGVNPGNVINGPTLTLLGEGGYSEAVVPFDPAAMAAFRPSADEAPPATSASPRISGPSASVPPGKNIQASKPDFAAGMRMQPVGPMLADGGGGAAGDAPGTPLSGPALQRGGSSELPPISKPTAGRPVTITGTLDLGANGMKIGEATLENAQIEGLDFG